PAASPGSSCKPTTVPPDPARRHVGATSEPVGLLEVWVLGRQQLRQVDHHLALLPGRVVLHLAVDHVHAAAIGDGLEDLPGEAHLVDRGAEDLLGDGDLIGMEGPGPDAPEEEGSAELVLAAEAVADVPEGAVEGEASGGGAGVDHARDRVVPRVLLRGDAR